MDKLKNYALLLCTLLFSLSFAACSDDDDPVYQGDPYPEELIGTWYYTSDVYVTFNSNGTGTLTMPADYSEANKMDAAPTAATTPSEAAAKVKSKILAVSSGAVSYSFTFSYEASTNTLQISFNNLIEKYIITSISSSQLVLTSTEGSVKTYTKNSSEDEDSESDSADTSTSDTIPSSLIETWSIAGTALFTINDDGTITFASDDTPVTMPYTYDANTGAVSVGGEVFLYVMDVVNNVLFAQMPDTEGVLDTYTFFPLTTADEWTIADISTLIGKNWYVAMEGLEVNLYFESSSTGVMTGVGDNSGTESFTYTYDTETKMVTFTIDSNGQKYYFEIYCLTDWHLIVMNYDDDPESEGDLLEMVAIE
ncbi:MAG: hypothetical protein Q4E59_00440 [Bacteroidales bacterium]|nr:hypothetical protein [Bacteroidales bacterium]